jgi:protease I
MVNAGATWLDQEFVRDGNLATSRGPQDLIPFVKGITELFAESSPIRNRRIAIAESSPQAAEPPQIVLEAMTWLPKPSIRTAFLLGAVGVAIAAANRRRLTA